MASVQPTEVTGMLSDTAVVTEGGGGNLGLALSLATLSGLTTGLGGLLVVLPNMRSFGEESLGHWQGAAAGFMVSVTVIELGPEVLSERLPLGLALAYAVLGGVAFLLLKAVVPEPDLTRLLTSPGGSNASNKNLKKVLWSGLLVALGLALHNFPEGMAVTMAALHGLDFGLSLSIAIAVHNIPEGAAVALPVFYATRSRRTAFLTALASGLAEPAGVLFVMAMGGARVVTAYRMASLLSGVAGVMLTLSLTELLPQAVSLTSPREAAASFGGGFVAMSGLLLLLDLLHTSG